MPPKRKVKDASLDNFRSSTSLFRGGEEKALRVLVRYSDTMDDVLHTNANCDSITAEVEACPLLLPSITEGLILTYIASTTDGMSRVQRRFLQRLRLVLLNDNPNADASQCEKLIDELMGLIMDELDFDDGLELTLRPCNLRLTVGPNKFAVIAAKEGRRDADAGPTWILQEHKHQAFSTYKRGDIQLACDMIAAHQQNYRLLGRLYPPDMLAVKVMTDSLYFARLTPSTEYIEELSDGLPSTPVELVLYPSQGFSLRSPSSRKCAIRCLLAMREIARSYNASMCHSGEHE